MKKLLSTGILLSIIASPSGAADMQSRDNPSPPTVNKRVIYANDQTQDTSDPVFALFDVIFYRPIGLAATIAGTAFFVGITPMTVLASIPEPHDAFEKTYKVLIRMPARYTFVRPVGDKSLSPYSAFYDSPTANSKMTYDYDLMPAIGIPTDKRPVVKPKVFQQPQPISGGTSP